MRRVEGQGLSEIQGRLARWRRQHGGRGRRIPEALWEQAVAVARVEGVPATARALRIPDERLERRVSGQGSGGRSPRAEAALAFVEIEREAGRAEARLAGRTSATVVEFVSRAGSRLRMEGSAAALSTLIGRAHALWSRGE
jgi:hypothetical protein